MPKKKGRYPPFFFMIKLFFMEHDMLALTKNVTSTIEPKIGEIVQYAGNSFTVGKKTFTLKPVLADATYYADWDGYSNQPFPGLTYRALGKVFGAELWKAKATIDPTKFAAGLYTDTDRICAFPDRTQCNVSTNGGATWTLNTLSGATIPSTATLAQVGVGNLLRNSLYILFADVSYATTYPTGRLYRVDPSDGFSVVKTKPLFDQADQVMMFNWDVGYGNTLLALGLQMANPYQPLIRYRPLDRDDSSALSDYTLSPPPTSDVMWYVIQNRGWSGDQLPVLINDAGTKIAYATSKTTGDPFTNVNLTWVVKNITDLFTPLTDEVIVGCTPFSLNGNTTSPTGTKYWVLLTSHRAFFSTGENLDVLKEIGGLKGHLPNPDKWALSGYLENRTRNLDLAIFKNTVDGTVRVFYCVLPNSNGHTLLDYSLLTVDSWIELTPATGLTTSDVLYYEGKYSSQANGVPEFTAIKSDGTHYIAGGSRLPGNKAFSFTVPAKTGAGFYDKIVVDITTA